MSKEECMEALEQMILELPQYRNITNEMCNTYICDYVRNEYENKEIYTEGNHNSSISYCWDIYNNVSINVLESILDYFKEIDDKQKQFKQKDKAIDECIELIAKHIQNCTYGEVSKYQELLEKLQQAKGDCDE